MIRYGVAAPGERPWFVFFGFASTVVHDACATRNLDFGNKKILAQEVHAAFMAALGSAYAQVVSYRDFVSKANSDG